MRRPTDWTGAAPVRQPSPWDQGEWPAPGGLALGERKARRQQERLRLGRRILGQRCEFAVHETGIDVACRKCRMCGDRAQQRQVVRDTEHRGAIQVPPQGRQCGSAVGARCDDLRDHRVVVDADGVAVGDAGVDAPVRARGRMHEAPDAPDRGQETAARVFAVDARLDGVALLADRGLLERQPLARRNAQLPFDEIEAGDQIR